MTSIDTARETPRAVAFGTPKARKPGRRHLLPGFGLTFGITALYLVLIVALPLAAMLLKTFSLGWPEFWRIVSSPRAISAYWITFSSAAAAAVFNGFFGLLLAWVLVRYEFPGKRIIDGLVDLPFALPTAVAGLALVTLFAPAGWYGQVLVPLGITVTHAQLGIIVAMAFTSLPFVVRTVQPVLEDIPEDVQEAARLLGATPFQVFSRVILPLILPAFTTGVVLCFARAIGEFGAVVFIAGNLPGMTEIVSLLIFIRLDEHNYPAAAALATVLLATAFVTLFLTNLLQAWQLRYADKSADASLPADPRRPQSALAWGLIGLAYLMAGVVLLVPLVLIVVTGFREGVGVYLTNIVEPETLHAIFLTVLAAIVVVPINVGFGIAAAWLVTRYEFRGKRLLITFIEIPFSVSPIVAGVIYLFLYGGQGLLGPLLAEFDLKLMFTVWAIFLVSLFVTSPFVARELIPLMQQQGGEDEEAALSLGANGRQIFWHVTLPNIRWALLYGAVLCNARVIGEFGAVSVVSGAIRGQTNTLPLQIELLFNDFNVTGAFAAASTLALLAVLTIVLKSVLERKTGH